MEKQAVVRAGLTPSEVSGKKSDFIKEGRAIAKGERIDPLSKTEEDLASKYGNQLHKGKYPLHRKGW